MSFDKPNDKHVFVATNILSRQNYVCRDKSFVAASITFVATKDVFVATKMILVAAPANDTVRLSVFVIFVAMDQHVTSSETQ